MPPGTAYIPPMHITPLKFSHASNIYKCFTPDNEISYLDDGNSKADQLVELKNINDVERFVSRLEAKCQSPQLKNHNTEMMRRNNSRPSVLQRLQHRGFPK